jgi:hypothetical protein
MSRPAGHIKEMEAVNTRLALRRFIVLNRLHFGFLRWMTFSLPSRLNLTPGRLLWT